MKAKVLNLFLFITSLLGYLEWSGDNHMFLITGEAEIIYKLFTNPTSAIHPFVLIPLLGQILLFFTLFQKMPSKTLTYISIIGIGLLLGFMFVIGIISLNLKILFSTIPFLTIAILTIRHFIKMKNNIMETRKPNR
jgi:hypothetical protein